MADSELEAMQHELLRCAYIAFFVENAAFDPGKVRAQHGWDAKLFQRALDEGMGICQRDSVHYEIQPGGAQVAEKLGLLESSLVEMNDQVQEVLLTCFGEVYERDGPNGSLEYSEAFSDTEAKTGAPAAQIEANFQYFLQLGLLQTAGSVSSFSLDRYHGMVAWTPLKRRKALAKKFEAIRGLEPRRRGRALEPVFGQAAEDDGWTVDLRVTSPGEEIDLVIGRGDSFYLVECKWEKNPIGPKEIRDFHGKLRERFAGVQGIFVSMSGFTKDAQALVERKIAETPTVLLGQQDAEEALTGRRTLEDLLADKKRALVLNRQAPWS